MTLETMTLVQIQSKGLELLARELGPVGFIRFIQAFETGSGDYTQERRQWLSPLEPVELAQQIKEVERLYGEQSD